MSKPKLRTIQYYEWYEVYNYLIDEFPGINELQELLYAKSCPGWNTPTRFSHWIADDLPASHPAKIASQKLIEEFGEDAKFFWRH